MDPEEWRVVPGASKYEVSSLGRVRSTMRGEPHIMSPATNHEGYSRLQICTDQGSVKQRFVHRLVLEAFVGPPTDGQQVRHLDGTRDNNAVSNLRWGTKSENELDKVAHGTDPQANRTHCPAGHAYDNANTHIRRQGWRECRACNRDRMRDLRSRRRAA